MIKGVRAFLGSNMPLVYAAGAVITVIIGMWLRIQYLEADRDIAIGKLEVANISLVVAKQTNAGNTKNIKTLAEQLTSCRLLNTIYVKNSKQALADLNKDLQKSREEIALEAKKVQEALKNEDCANTVVPNDVERVLRNGAASANGDRDS